MQEFITKYRKYNIMAFLTIIIPQKRELPYFQAFANLALQVVLYLLQERCISLKYPESILVLAVLFRITYRITKEEAKAVCINFVFVPENLTSQIQMSV